MIYCGFKQIEEHTVIPGVILSVEKETDCYHVKYAKRTPNKRIGGDFDDLGRKRIFDLYHYNQASVKND